MKKGEKSKKVNMSVIMALMLTGTLLAGTEAMAAVKEQEAFTLGQILVTATRYEKPELEIAASTEVITREELQRTGARNLQQALAKVNGVVYQAKGPGGGSLGSMTSKVSIRGVEKGTLVLLNGTPINWRGLYNLEDIPTESIERVEIVRGGGAVLYGSEATGGVINIITKEKLENSFNTGFGNYGQQNHGFTTQTGKLGISYNYDKWGKIGKVSSTLSEASKPGDKEMYNVFKGSEKNDLALNYKISDYANVIYSHNQSVSKFAYTFGEGYALSGSARYDRRHERDKDFVQINFKDDSGMKGNLFYNSNTLHSVGTDYYSSAGSSSGYPMAKDDREKNLTYGYDVQKLWDNGKGKFLFGTTFTREEYKDWVLNAANADYNRNNFSLYGQWEKNFTDKDLVTLSARETWTTGAAENKNYNNFSAQGQYIHKLDAKQSIYASIGQSFVMPSFSNMYSTGTGLVVGDPDLRPQKGMHYELGWKKDHDDHRWRAALFNYKIKDNMSFSKSGDKYYAVNEDLKNTGIEIGAEILCNNGWTYNYGLAYGNPKSKAQSEKVGTKDYWDRAFGRWQLDGGVSYTASKLTTSLSASYLADRVLTPTTKHSVKTKPYLLTSLNANYKADKRHEFNLSIENLLDRKDNVNHTTSAYYSAPINYMLSYKYKF